MDNVKNDAYYVKKMLNDIRFIMEKTKGITVCELKENEKQLLKISPRYVISLKAYCNY